MTIIGKSLMHLSRPFQRRAMIRNYSVFLRNRLRCEKWTEVKRNCLARSCYTNISDKDPKKNLTTQKDKYKEYMDTVGDRKGIVNKSTNYGRILPVGLLNDFNNSSKILIIPINCEQDQTFLEKPEAVNAIKIIRKHFKEIETFAEYSKPYITVLRNPDMTHTQNMLQVVPVNRDAVMTAAITDFTPGKPGSSKVMSKDLEEVFKSITKSDPEVKKDEVNEFDVNNPHLHENILESLKKSSAKLPHKLYQHRVAKPVAQPVEQEALAKKTSKTNQKATVNQTATKAEEVATKVVEPVKPTPVDKVKQEAKEAVAPQEVVASKQQDTAKVFTEEKVSPAAESTSATTEQPPVEQPSTTEQQKTSNEQPPPIVQMSSADDQASSESQISPKNEESEEPAVSAHNSALESEEEYINPYPETELEAESKPSITSITFDFETDLSAKEELIKDEIISEEMKSVAMNMSTVGMSTPEQGKDKQWIPINFNAVITGSVKMPPEKLPNDQVTNMEPEELNKLIGDILANIGEGAFHPKDALIKQPKHEVTSAFMVAPQVREESPYSDGKSLMDAAVYKRAVEETKKIKQDLASGPMLVEMKSANDSCKVCSAKGTTCKSKKSGASCGDNKDGPKKVASSMKCGGEEKPERPSCKKSDDKLRKGCEESAPKGVSNCGAKLKPCKPCAPKKKECGKSKSPCKKKSSSSCGKAPAPGSLCTKKEESPCGAAKKESPCGAAKKESPCGAAKKESPCGAAKKESPCGAAKKESPCGGSKKASPCGDSKKKSPCGASKKKPGCEDDGDTSCFKLPCGKKDKKGTCGDDSKKDKPCGKDKPKTNPNCGKKDGSCSGGDKKDKWDMSYTKLLYPVIHELGRIRIFNRLPPPYMESVRWFRGSIIRRWNRDEDVIMNKTLFIQGRGIMDIKEEQINAKEIAAGDVVVKVDTVALTGSDFFLFETGNNLLSLGHGSSGIVTQVGSHVTSLEVNDRVAIEPAVPCGSCPKCLGGLYNVCPNIVFKGSLSKFCIHPALFCHKLPECVSLEDASLLNTLATAYHACVKAKISAKSNIIVIGSCPLALSTVMCARAMGAAKILVASAIHTNTKLAKEIGGADGVINLSEIKNDNEILTEILSTMPLVDVVIDCSGCSQSINVATKALKAQGRCVLAGCQSEKAQLNIFEAQLKEVKLIPSLWSCNMFPAAIKLLESNRAPLSELITHRFGFLESQIAFEKSIQRGDNGVIQTVIKCQTDFI